MNIDDLNLNNETNSNAGSTPPVEPLQPTQTPPVPNNEPAPQVEALSENINPIPPTPITPPIPPMAPQPAPQAAILPEQPTSQPSVLENLQPVNEQVEELNLAPEGVVVNEVTTPTPEPLVGSTLTADTPLIKKPEEKTQPIASEQPNVNNNINVIETNPPTFGGIATPTENSNPLPVQEPHKKDNTKKIIIIILVVILILSIGMGVYYFLNIANTKTPQTIVTPKISEWELGKTLSSKITDFADFTGIDANSCTLDVSNININETGNYSYTITCPSLKQPITKDITVHDTLGPEVELKEVFTTPNTNVSLEDFVLSCEDPSLEDKCEIIIADETISLEELVKKEGEYTIPLTIRDDLNHETKVNASLIVTENAPVMVLDCVSNAEEETTTSATVTSSYKYGISANNEIVSINKILDYQFKGSEDYLKAKEEYNQNSTIDNNKGVATFKDSDNKLSLKTEMKLEDLKAEFNLEQAPQTFQEISTFHENLGDKCSLS